MVDESRLVRWMVLSILLHALLLPALTALRHAQVDFTPPKFVDVDLAQLPKLVAPPKALPKAPAPAEAPPAPPAVPVPNQQIVSPPDAGEQKAPENTRLLSDRDNTVTQESLKRAPAPSAEEVPKRADAPLDAEPNAATAQKKVAHQPAAVAEPKRVEAKPNTAPRERPRANEQIAALPKLDQLLPGAGDFAALAKQAVEAGPQPTPAERAAGEKRRLLIGSDRPAFAMRPGISDFLPGVRESDITLLNTKAERFAPFVRRVAARVFQHLDIRLRQTARSTSTSGHEYAVVEAVMSKKGRLVNARVVERQSNTALSADRILLGVAAPDTFFDENPPAGAEGNDGNIHFMLLVDLNVQAVADPRTGRAATYYEGIAGVGLDSLARRDQG